MARPSPDPAMSIGAHPLSRALSLLAAVGVTASVFLDPDPNPLWALIVATIGLLAWVLLSLLRSRTRLSVEVILRSTLIAVGALLVTSIPVAGGVLLIAGLLGLIGDARIAWLYAFVAAGSAAALIAVIALRAPLQPESLLAALGFVVLGVVLGITRRSQTATRVAELRLAQQLAATQTERARSAALDERARIARDLHDTLAHTLGGLVVQLDAVEALAEAGRIDDVITRARAARGMAADGLVEAREAVASLKEDPLGKEDIRLNDAIRTLVDLERSLGATIVASIDSVPATIKAETASAFRRVAQEALTNARKHAPGEPLSLNLNYDDRSITLAVENARGHNRENDMPLHASGSGQGLAGMRARMSACPGGSLIVTENPSSFSIVATADSA
ncbi:hypothetical protein G7068_10185 [Leucobacter viscericola]|uniref:histidine kinase n=1 Tax=Leucobacter viscericola TaxID=2714935 RepID=A0A6G7XGC7_9MICO|nr:histidine kinase [Leucobacter viscericola]QIK63526.1 hypothetical protein G7068_10185 [Leucobacter viscericola]